MTIEHSVDTRSNTKFERRDLRVGSAGSSAATAAALVELAAAAALAFITVVRATEAMASASRAVRPACVRRQRAPPGRVARWADHLLAVVAGEGGNVGPLR